MVHLFGWVEILPGLFFSSIWCHLVSLGVSQLETRLFRIIYDDLIYMSGILAYVEFGILKEVPEKLDFSYFLST